LSLLPPHDFGEFFPDPLLDELFEECFSLFFCWLIMCCLSYIYSLVSPIGAIIYL
jgi:hypothetical protein